jgi:hypothetical protein
MATTTTPNGSKKMKFKPIENFDVDALPPDLPAGKWSFVIDKCIVRATSPEKGSRPMLSFKYKVTAADEPENESYVGKSIDEVVIFYANDETDNLRAAKMSKVKLRQLCELVDMVADIPKSITEETLEEFAEALTGKEFDAWTTVRTMPDSNEQRANVQYVEPGGGLKLSSNEEEEEEEKPKKGASSKKTSRR